MSALSYMLKTWSLSGKTRVLMQFSLSAILFRKYLVYTKSYASTKFNGVTQKYVVVLTLL